MLAAFARQLPRITPALSTSTARLVHTLPDLDYKYEALEPIINREIMEIHHTKHHQTYVNNLNTTEAAFAEATSQGNIERAISLDMALRFNGGGHINHSIFWKNLSPNGGGTPKGDLLDIIERDYGSFDRLKEELSAKTIAIQGSGWGWLGYNPITGRIRIATCPNQDPLLPTTGLIPLLGIDVWEHAYYLQYKNVRPDYVKEIWNIFNWDDVSERLAKARMDN